MKPKTIALLGVGVLFAIILFQNMDDVEFKVLFWEPLEMPKLVLVLSSVFLGWVIGWITHMAYQKGKKKKAAKAPPTISRAIVLGFMGRFLLEKFDFF